VTVIIGAVTASGDVVMGADRGVSGENFIESLKQPKMLSVADGVILGISGCALTHNILRRISFPSCKGNINIDDYVYGDLSETLRSALENHNVVTVDQGERTIGSTILIGVKGRLFRMQPDLSVYESLDNRAIVGWGAPYALGALHGVSDMDLIALDVLGALRATAYYCPFVQLPFDLWTLSRDGVLSKDVVDA
jgi:20S proteasome alpha/beta subunit